MTGVPTTAALRTEVGKIPTPGVYPPEACIDREWFLLAVSTRDLAEVNEEVVDWDRDQPTACLEKLGLRV